MPLDEEGKNEGCCNLKNIDGVQKTTENIENQLGHIFRISLYLSENEDKNYIVSMIQEAIDQIDENEIYASGSEGNIYIIDFCDRYGEKKQLLVSKKRFDNSPENEYKIHEKMQNLIEEGSLVQVPKLRGVFESKGYNYVVMSFVKGKTLYHKIAEGIIERKASLLEENSRGKSEVEKNLANQRANYLRSKIESAQSDSDVDHIFLELYEYNSQKSEKAFDYDKGKKKIFLKEEGEKYFLELGKFITMMHENGIYHRDLHEKNIIFGDDGKIYIIDFGKSIYFDPKNGKPCKDNIYLEQEGEMIGTYVKDEDIVWQIKGLTKTEQDEDTENFTRQCIERENKLKEGKMLIDQVDFEKIKSKKILNKIKKCFGGIEQLKKQVKKEEKTAYSINSFIDLDDNDFLLSLFSMTNENLQYLLASGISDSKKFIYGKIKMVWNPVLGEDSWKNLFGDDDLKIDVKFLEDVLKQMWNKKGYGYLYKGRNFDFIRDLKPMRDYVGTLLQIQEIQLILDKINNAIKK